MMDARAKGLFLACEDWYDSLAMDDCDDRASYVVCLNQ